MGHAQGGSIPLSGCCSCGGSGNYKTIQEAVNAAPDGQDGTLADSCKEWFV